MIYFNKVNFLVFAFLLSLISICGNAQVSSKQIKNAINEAFIKYKDVTEGENACNIKELAQVDSSLFGIAVVTVDGDVITEGDFESMVSIQSISKVFTLAQVIEEQGPKTIEDKIGVDATGEVFNSITAIEKMNGKEINSFVNPGAIATTSLIKGNDSTAKWSNIRNTYSAFAGRELTLNMPVYISEANDNLRNQAIAHLLLSYNRMYFDPVQTTDIYTKQCALNVNSKDLAIMAATLSNGGKNPVTNKEVVSSLTTQHTLAVMATAGLYDDAGIWFYHTGIPAKSGVGGGIIAVVPGQFGIAVIAPPLDKAGNSVKAQLVIKYVINELGLNPYSIKPK